MRSGSRTAGRLATSGLRTSLGKIRTLRGLGRTAAGLTGVFGLLLVGTAVAHAEGLMPGSSSTSGSGQSRTGRAGGAGAGATGSTAVTPEARTVGAPGFEVIVRAATADAPATQTITYLGHDFTVPAAWPVVDLASHPTSCVLFDVHAVYVGTPGPQQECPANAVGRHTGALLIEPAAQQRSNAAPASTEYPGAGLIAAHAPGLTVLASYGGDRKTVVSALTSAGLPQPTSAPTSRTLAQTRSAIGATTIGATATASATAFATASASPSPTATPTPLSGPVDPTWATEQAQGLGFDTCNAPSDAQMQAWAANSPYQTVGIYLGGSDFACSANPNLTPGWLTTQSAAGWHTMPLWVGPQVAFGQISSATAQGTQNADAAIAAAEALGYKPGAVIYYDMEAYTVGGSNSATAMAFLSAWTLELHHNLFRSAVYGSESSVIADLDANIGLMTEPDVISVANWNGSQDDDPGAAPPADWPNARVHQYAGGHDETYGGATINIDNDYLNVQLPYCLPPFSAPGHSDAENSGRCALLVATPSSSGGSSQPTSAPGPTSTP